MPMVTATVFCLPWPIRWACISAYSVLSLWGLYKVEYVFINQTLLLSLVEYLFINV